jgi:hypothetical protein
MIKTVVTPLFPRVFAPLPTLWAIHNRGNHGGFALT